MSDHGRVERSRDEVTIEIDTLVVQLSASDAAAVAEGRLDALGTAVVAALQNDSTVSMYLPARVVTTTTHGRGH